jgi:hypothetical protein
MGKHQGKFTETTHINPTESDWEWTYEDMRGRHWLVKQRKGPPPMFVAFPEADAAAAYQLKRDVMFSAATHADMLIDGIEERLESARAAGVTPGEHFYQVPASSKFPWLLVVIGALLLTDKRGSRRR